MDFHAIGLGARAAATCLASTGQNGKNAALAAISAALRGSKMCIRDSYRGCWDTAERTGGIQ